MFWVFLISALIGICLFLFVITIVEYCNPIKKDTKSLNYLWVLAILIGCLSFFLVRSIHSYEEEIYNKASNNIILNDYEVSLRFTPKIIDYD